jgi:hypothetical protein
MSDDPRCYLRPNSRNTNEASWKVFQEHVKQLAQAAFAKGKAVEIVAREKKRNRSLAQNRLLWGVVYREIRDHINDSQGTQFSDEDIHEWCRQQFLDSHIVEIRGDPVRARKSTASLTVEQMTDYIDRLYHWAATSLGVQLSEPEDMMAEAYGRDRGAA